MTDLTTLASFKAYAGVVIATDDAMLTSLISAYSEFARSYCNRDFTLRTYSRRLDGLNTRRQMVSQVPIGSVTSVTVDTQTIAAQIAFGQPGYYFDSISVMLEGYRFTRGIGNVAITWTGGYATIPADVAQAVNEMVGLRYKLRDKMEWSSKGLAGETVSLITKDMPSASKRILDQYKSVVAI